MSREIEILRRVYDRLEACAAALLGALRAAGFSARMGFFNGHYRKDDSGQYRRDSYPIPELEVECLCDVEIGPEEITVSALLSREDALSLDPAALSGFDFQIYGAEDYLLDFWEPGMSAAALRERIRQSSEAEIGFSFTVSEADVPRLVHSLSQLGFYQNRTA